MQAATVSSAPRDKEQARVRALVRFNGVSFYGLAMASCLEAAATLQAERIARLFGTLPGVALWVEQGWRAQRGELARALRGYGAAVWPEFDWDGACQEFLQSYRPRTLLAWRYGSVALETLGLCTTAAQAALFYRTLSRAADDPALRELARQAAACHAGYFDYFRDLYERCRRHERVGIVRACRTVAAACRAARDADVAVAFQVLANNWNGAPVVPAMTYPEYRLRMVRLMQRHGGLGPVERLLFRPWLQSGDVTGGAARQPAATRDTGWCAAPQAA